VIASHDRVDHVNQTVAVEIVSRGISAARKRDKTLTNSRQVARITWPRRSRRRESIEAKQEIATGSPSPDGNVRPVRCR
jgi:hypothetical protein